MSDNIEDKPLVAIVSKPKKYLKPRKGKGFSPKEIKSASKVVKKTWACPLA